MPFLNFGGNKNKHFNLSNMNFFMKNMKNRYSDPDPDPLFPNVDPTIRIHYYGEVDPRIWIRIHFSQMWIRGSGSGSTITERWIRGSGSGSTFPNCGFQDLDPCQNEMDPKCCFIDKKRSLIIKIIVLILNFSFLMSIALNIIESQIYTCKNIISHIFLLQKC